MSLSTVSATVVDPSGQAFANGTWQLVFKPAPNTPGLFTDGGVPFTTIFRGNLDGAGSFSQVVARNDTIAPAGSKWILTVAPNASGQAFSVDLNVNSGAFNASAAINAIITNIVVQAVPITHAYKDSEVIPIPGSGGLYYDVTLKVLKIWDAATGIWISLTPLSGAVLLNPLAQQTINGFPLVLEGTSLGFSAPGSTASDINISRVSAGVLALGNTVVGDGQLNLTSVRQGVSTNSFSIVDNLGISHFFISNSTPYINTFITGNGAGNVFIGSAAKTNIADTTGVITTAASLTLQNGSQLLPATVANDTTGGVTTTSNGGKSLQWNNSGVLIVNPSALIRAAALTVGGTSSTTGGISIFIGTSGAQNEVLAVDPNDGSTAATRIAALSIRSLSGGMLNGAQNAGITNAGVASGLRITPRQIAMADAAAITPTSDTADINIFVSTQIAGTLTVNAPSGTPTDGQKLTLRLKSTNAQTYSFNATYAFSTSVIAPTTLAAGKTDYIGLMWNATNTKWDVVAVDQGH